MKKRTFVILALALAASALILSYFLAISSNPFNARVEVQQAWQTARNTGGYSFRADMVEKAIPLAQTSNIGRKSKEYTYHLEGMSSGLNASDFASRKFEMSLWDQGGSVLDPKSAAQFQVQNGKAMARRGDQAWQEIEDISGGFAPAGDFMAFLSGAKNIVNTGSETHNGISFTRYTFELDGPGFAAFVRDQLQARMREQGELPYAMNLDLPAQYENMTGEGELWVRENGLPLREIITAHFPPVSAKADSRTDYDITVDFFDYAYVENQKPFFPSGARLTGFVDLQKSFSNFTPPAFPSSLLPTALALVVFSFLLYFFARYYRDRRVYAAVTLFVIFAMEANPLMQTAQASTFVDMQHAKTEQQQEKTDSQKEQREFAEKFQEESAWKPQNDPRVEAQLANNPPGTTNDQDVSAAKAAVACTDTTDSDGDGLSNCEKVREDESTRGQCESEDNKGSFLHYATSMVDERYLLNFVE